MPNITLSIPEDVYRRMKKHPEVRWSKIARDAIIEYLQKIEGKNVVSSDELLKELGEEFAVDLAAISLEDAIKHYKKMREAEWKRFSTIQAV